MWPCPLVESWPSYVGCCLQLLDSYPLEPFSSNKQHDWLSLAACLQVTDNWSVKVGVKDAMVAG
jgi:hypothetical protein